MLDSLLNRRGIRDDILDTEGYTPDQAITSRQFLNESGTGLAVLFPPWHNAGWFYEHLAKRLVAKNWAVLNYQFHGEILKPNVQQVVASFETISLTISRDIKEANQAHDYSDVYLIGTSLGNVALARTARQIDRVTRADIVVGGASLAVGTWNGTRTPRVRGGLEATGLSLDDLESQWKSLSPLHNCSALSAAKIRMFLSTTDTIIPSTDQQTWAQGFIEKGMNPELYQTSLGHFATIARYCVFDSLPRPH